MLVARHFDDPLRKVIALLHDIVEDTDVSIDDVYDMFGIVIFDAIDSLTRRKNEKYEDYIIRLSNNSLAKDIKIADLEENLHSAKYCYKGRYDTLIPRYENALSYLQNK